MALRHAALACLLVGALTAVMACSDDTEATDPGSSSTGGTSSGGSAGSNVGGHAGSAGGSGGSHTGGAAGSGGSAGSATGGSGTGGSSTGGGAGTGGTAGAGTGGTAGSSGVEILADATDDDPQDLAVDDTDVFWGGVGLHRVPKGGGQAEELTVTGTSHLVRSLEVDGSALYYSPDIDATDRVFKIAKTGGAPTLLGSSPDMETSMGADIAIDATQVYWLQSSGTGMVVKVDKNGGARTVLAEDMSGTTGIDVYGTDVVWTNWVSKNVQKVPTTGGTTTELATNQNYPWAIRMTADGVFWVNRASINDTPATDGSVVRLDTGGTMQTLADGLSGPTALAVDATDVYFTCYFDGTVRKVPIGGGEVTTIATDQVNPTHIVSDATHVYWIDATRVMRAAK